MNKTELMETYTAEQLAEMEKLYRDITQCREHSGEHLHSEEYLKILNLNRTISELQSEVEKYRKAFEDAKKERGCQIAEYQKRIDDLEQKLKRQEVATKYAQEYVENLENELKDLEIQIEEEYKPLEIEVEALRKNERELSEENEELHSKIERSGNISDFLQTEPIKVADMLINTKIEPTEIGEDRLKIVYKQRNFDISELRQIAEHLLVYCNHNGEVEE